jgi:hypothetical protein
VRSRPASRTNLAKKIPLGVLRLRESAGRFLMAPFERRPETRAKPGSRVSPTAAFRLARNVGGDYFLPPHSIFVQRDTPAAIGV